MDAVQAVKHHMPRKKILIIEDEEGIRQLEKTVAESVNCDVIEADNFKDGIDLALKELPDLIILDLRLPHKKRGIGLAKSLRKRRSTRGIPIIFVSAYPVWEETRELDSVTNCSFITKPFKIKELAFEIRKYLNI